MVRLCVPEIHILTKIRTVGVEAALGGWVVSFMLHVRGATPYASGIVGTGFVSHPCGPMAGP